MLQADLQLLSSTLSNRMDQVARETRQVGDQLSQILARTSKIPSREETPVIALALDQLRRLVDSGGAYDSALSLICFLANDDPTIASLLEPLKAHAVSGLPDRATLIVRFLEMADVIQATILARNSQDSQQTLWNQALGKLESLVKVRYAPSPNVVGTDVNALLARAESRLNRGDLAGAVSEVTSLNLKEETVVQGWLTDASARLEAERMIDALNNTVMASLHCSTTLGEGAI
jgi:hypothetical protein